MKTIFKIYIMVVRHCAWQILSSLGAELLVAMLGPIGLQVYEKQVQALEAGALEQFSIFNVGSNTVTLASGWDLMAFIRQMISPENGGDAQ